MTNKTKIQTTSGIEYPNKKKSIPKKLDNKPRWEEFRGEAHYQKVREYELSLYGTEEYNEEYVNYIEGMYEIARLEAEKRIEEEKLKKYQMENKLLFFNHKGMGHLGKHGTWEYNPPQKKIFAAYENPKFDRLLLTGANRISKTFSSFCIILATILGHWPWQDRNEVGQWIHEMKGWEGQLIKVKWVGQGWESHIKGTLIPLIDELLPKEIIDGNLWGKKFEVKRTKNNQGVDHLFKFFENGEQIGEIVIGSNTADTSVHEGSYMHLLTFDEPPREEIHTACIRGLQDVDGRELIAGSIIKEPWIEDKIINKLDDYGNPDPSIFVLKAVASDNAGHGLTQESIDKTAKKYSEEEYRMRILGENLGELTRVFPKFSRDLHVVQRRAIPTNWIVDIHVDVHPAKPHAVIYQATCENNMKWLIFENNIDGNGQDIVDSILETIKLNNLRVDTVLVDPLSKCNGERTNTTWNILMNQLTPHGIHVAVGSKQKSQGIININSYLMSSQGIVRYFIFNDLVNTIREYQNWRYVINDNTGHKEPSKKHDDFCEGGYRLALLQRVYTDKVDVHEYEEEVSEREESLNGY